MSLLTDEEIKDAGRNAWELGFIAEGKEVARAQQTKTLRAMAEWLVLVREEIDREHPSMDSPARYGLFVARITDALPLLSEGKLPGEAD